MKKTNLLLASIATLGLLASCGGNSKPSEPTTPVNPDTTESTPVDPSTPATNELTREEADAKVETFEDAVKGTINLTYTAKYKMDVETENEGAKGFARDIDDVTTAELDLTEGNLYAHVKRVGMDATKEEEKSTLEALVYKNGEKYYFLKNTSADPLELKDEKAARAKIDELLKGTSSREGGYVDTTSLIYSGINTYEHHTFHLDSTNVDIDMMDDPVKYEKNDNGGITVYSEPTYVGYGTDQGVSDLHAEPGAHINVATDAKGYVTSYTETYNSAELEMPIFMPAPILTLTGSRTLEAVYGGTIDRLETIEHKRTTGTLNFPETFNGGDVTVFTCAPNDFEHMKPASRGDAVDVDYWICIKVTPWGKNTVKAVLHNNSGTTLVPPEVAGGFYCFAVVEGDNNISVAFEGDDVAMATVSIKSKDAGVKDVKLAHYDYKVNPEKPEAMDEDGKAPFGPTKFVAITITCEEGKVVDKVIANGEEIQPMFGGYQLNVKEAKLYEVEITTKDAEPAPTETKATITVKSKDEGVKSVKIQTFVFPNFAEMTDLPEGGKVEVVENLWISVEVTCNEGKTVDQVLVNEAPAMKQETSTGYLSSIKEATTYEIVITTK